MKIDPDDHLGEDPFIQKMKPRNKLNKQKKDVTGPIKQGRVLFLSPDAIHLADEKKEIVVCSLKGTLKKQLKQTKDRLACGDLVFFNPQKQVITELLPRKTILMRQNPSQKHKDQILATNIDLLLITTSVVEPKLNPYLIDLYIMAAKRSGLEPILLINKVDLLKKKKCPQKAKSEKKLLAQLIQQYQALDIPVLEISAVSLEGFSSLKTLMKDKASVFSGESGVGKSSLINVLSKSKLKVAPVSSKQKGTHTTTSSQLLSLNDGGFCVDTPGIQSFGFNHLKPTDIKQFFPEFKTLKCRFSNCNHQDELGCGIKEALEKKEISPLRLDSYYRILSELQT